MRMIKTCTKEAIFLHSNNIDKSPWLTDDRNSFGVQKFDICANDDYHFHRELDDEVQTGESERIKQQYH